MSKLFGAIFITAIIFRKAFQDHAKPSMLLLLGIVCTVSAIIVIFQVIFGKK